MAYRIEIALKRGVHDGRGAGVAARARNFFHLPVAGCATRDVFNGGNREPAGLVLA